jgi:hypothetical protein
VSGQQMASFAPGIVAKLNERVEQEAEPLRQQALELLAKADLIGRNAKRMGSWLRRVDGTSHLGQYPYEQLPAPDPERGGELTIAELHAATHFDPGAITDPDGKPPEGFVHEEPGLTYSYVDAGGAFGTDDPENLGEED